MTLERSTDSGEDLLIGRTLDGRFKVTELLGVGGVGRVYKAVQSRLNRPVALKVLNKGYGQASDSTFLKRFFLEASLTAQLRHPNCVTVIDYGCTKAGDFYIAMEYLEGETLAEVLSSIPALPWHRVLRIGEQVARALSEAHRLGVVHRDLKPSNVMVLAAGRDQDLVKVLDFGLVKSFAEGRSRLEVITEQGVLVGSPQYMAPEQVEDNQADPRSDIYALGVVLYEMLCGRPPFRGRSHVDVLLRHVNDPVPPLRAPVGKTAVPEALERLVLRCLEKNPARRPQSMDEVLAQMQSLSSFEGRAVPSSPRRRLGPALLFGGAVLIGLVIVSSLFLAQRDESTSAEATAPLAPAAAALMPVAAPLPMPDAKARPPVVTGLERIRFKVNSEPQGARVSHRGKSLGKTPLSFDLPPGRDGAAKAELEFVLAGYHPLKVTTGGAGPSIELSQKLQPLKKAKRSRKRHKPRKPEVMVDAQPAQAVDMPPPESVDEPPSAEPVGDEAPMADGDATPEWR